MKENEEWFRKWFNEDYLNLYSTHDMAEAQRHVDFLIARLSLTGTESILDLGCGTGRHALAFGLKGFSVLGIDLSPILIKEANAQRDHLKLKNVEFKIQDMRHLSGIGEFQLIINIFTSFGYFEQDRENVEILRSISPHLKRGGHFFLDYLHPAEVKKHLVEYEEKWINGEKVEIHKSIQGDSVIKNIQFPGRSYQEKVKLYSREVIEKMLKDSGLVVDAVWNDYEGTPWRPDGDRQLFLTQGVALGYQIPALRADEG